MRRKEQAAASRAMLVSVARELFGSVGFDDTTVAEILRRAGMARGALYHYFPDGKSDLFRAVFDELNGELHRSRDRAQREPTLADGVQAGARAFLELCSRQDFARVMLADAPRLIPGQSLPGSSFAVLHEEIASALEGGAVTSSLDASTITHLLHGAIREAGIHVAAAPDKSKTITACLDGLALMAGSLMADTTTRGTRQGRATTRRMPAS